MYFKQNLAFAKSSFVAKALVALCTLNDILSDMQILASQAGGLSNLNNLNLTRTLQLKIFLLDNTAKRFNDFRI